MAGPSWLVDSKRIATKIKSASIRSDSKRVIWKSNPSRACPKCNHVIDNSDVTHEWPGLPSGVKFDPSDQEIIWHLLAKVGNGNVKPHPFLEEFIPTVNEEDGICYTHPQNLPGVKQDGSVSHFFHRAIKAYNTGTRKRRKIHGDELGEVRWHKTGRTKPVILDGIQMGCKKIMVLYMNTTKSGKPEKTSWVMHQYHLGTGEDEKDGEFVVSKVFYQQQTKLTDKVEQDLSSDITEAPITKVDPVTPKSVVPEPRRAERWLSDVDPGEGHEHCAIENSVQSPVTMNFESIPVQGVLGDHDIDTTEVQENHMEGDHDETKFWIGGSQIPFDSQQLDSQYNSQELLALCNELLRSQPSSQPSIVEEGGEDRRNGPDYSRSEADVVEVIEGGNFGLHNENSSGRRRVKHCVNDYVQGPEGIKEESEEVRNVSKIDLSDIVLDTPPDFRLSQIEFESDDSFFNWAGSKLSD